MEMLEVTKIKQIQQYDLKMACLVKSEIHTHMTSYHVIFLQNAARIIITEGNVLKLGRPRKWQC